MRNPSPENPNKRPREIIDYVEKICAESGDFEAVDEEYYQAFLHLTQSEIENMTVIMMLDRQKDIREIARDHPDEAVQRVSKFMCDGYTSISLGLMRVDIFGRLRFFARIGPEPDLEMYRALEKRLDQIKPVVRRVVRRTLPWLLSLESSQGELPL